MPKTFAPLDDALIEHVFQPASDLMADRLGFGCASAACFCIDLASLAWVVSRAGGLSGAASNWGSVHSLLDMAMLLLGLVALGSLRTLFRRAGGRPANPLRQAMRPHRAIILLMLVARVAQLRSLAVSDLADLAMLGFAASALYLGACAVRPRLRRGLALSAISR